MEVAGFGGSTHAWVQVYLPGAGWVEFDPTNGIVGNSDLVRVAVARTPEQAMPLSGTFDGAATDFAGMDVKVKVTAEPTGVPEPIAIFREPYWRPAVRSDAEI